MRSENVSTLRMLGLAVVLSVIATGCGDAASSTENVTEGVDLSGLEITVGSKEFTEQEILGQIAIEVLRAAGANVEDQTGVGGTDAARQALTAGVIDAYWEYTGTGWLVHLGHENPIPDSQEQFQAVAEEDLEENNIRWLAPPAPANNTYTIAVRSEVFDQESEAYDEDLDGVRQISDLGQFIQENPEKATLCANSEFINREDGLPGVENAYGFEFPDENIIELNEDLVYQAVDEGEACNFGAVFKTDGRIDTLDLSLLEDDEDFFAIYNPSLTVRQEVYEEYPEIQELFAPISRELDTETLRRLNASVDVEGEPVREVARRFLEENGFLSSQQLTK